MDSTATCIVIVVVAVGALILQLVALLVDVVFSTFVDGLHSVLQIRQATLNSVFV